MTRVSSPQVSDNCALRTVIYLKRIPRVDSFVNKLSALAKPCCICLSHFPLALPPPAPFTSPVRIRRITLSTLASHHRDQSLLAPGYNPTLRPHLASRAALYYIARISLRFAVSPPNTHYNRARIGHHSRVISAQRGTARRGATRRNVAG